MKIETKLASIVALILVAGSLYIFTSSEPIAKNNSTVPDKQFVEISTPDGFVNTNGEEVTIQKYLDEGKVVLLDIWTYSCINCQRTLPYLNAWYEKYHDAGLEIIGLHTPEFSFEHKIENVKKAVLDFDIEYPVVLDNDYSTWRAWGNNYWPRKYLIYPDGSVIYDHIGEGAYDETEVEIQNALERFKKENGLSTKIEKDMVKVVSEKSESGVSPETYFGSLRNETFTNGERGVRGNQTLLDPQQIEKDGLYLSGKWTIENEYAESQSTDSKIIFLFRAKKVYLVADSDKAATIKVLIDGSPVKTGSAGSDISTDSNVEVKDSRLYNLIDLNQPEEHVLQISVPKGVRAFAFTFG